MLSVTQTVSFPTEIVFRKIAKDLIMCKVILATTRVSWVLIFIEENTY